MEYSWRAGERVLRLRSSMKARDQRGRGLEAVTLLCKQVQYTMTFLRSLSRQSKLVQRRDQECDLESQDRKGQCVRRVFERTQSKRSDKTPQGCPMIRGISNASQSYREDGFNGRVRTSWDVSGIEAAMGSSCCRRRARHSLRMQIAEERYVMS